MANVIWPKSDVDEIKTSTALRDIKEQVTQVERRAREREQMTAAPAPVSAPAPSSWDFSSLRSTLMPWAGGEAAQQQQPAAAPPAQTDEWDLSSLFGTLTPWETPKPTPSGTPTAMPSAPGLVDATITTGPRPGQTLQPGESVGSVTLQGQAPPQAAPGSRQAHAIAMAQKYGVDPAIFDRQLTQESGYSDSAVSYAGARGPGQFMPETGNAVARQMGVTPEQFWASPELQIEGAALHMRDLLKANNGDYRRALAAYNAGQGNVDKWGEGVFDDDFANGQTRDYVNIILGPGQGSPRRQSSMNTGPDGAPPSGPAPTLGAGVSSPPAPGLPPSVAARWQQRTGGAEMTDEDMAQLRALGVIA